VQPKLLLPEDTRQDTYLLHYLYVPHTNLNFSSCSFHITAKTVWNSLPPFELLYLFVYYTVSGLGVLLL